MGSLGKQSAKKKYQTNERFIEDVCLVNGGGHNMDNEMQNYQIHLLRALRRVRSQSEE